MKRSDILKEKFAKLEAGQKARDDRDLPWTPMTRKMFLQPDVYLVPENERVFRQPAGVKRFSRPIPGQSLNQFVANSRDTSNSDRIHTPHIYDRRNFQAPSTISRASGLVQANFDATPEDIAKDGMSSLLTKPVDVNIPDARDTEWIAERARLDSIGQPHVLPLGRNQLTFKKRVTLIDEFAQSISNAHTMKTKLAAVSHAVGAGITKSKAGMVAINNQLGKILIQNINLNKLTGSQLNDIYAKIRALHVKDWMTAGFSQRFWSQRQYKTKQLDIVMYLISRVLSTTKTPNQPILKFEMDGKSNKLNMTTVKNVALGFLSSIDKIGTPVTEIKDVKQATRRNILYIDLKTGGIVPLKYVINQVRAGVDNGELNDIGITAAPKPGKRDLIPVGIMSPKWAANNATSKQAQRWAVDFFGQDKMIVVDTKTGNNVPFRIMPKRVKKPTPTPSPAGPP